MHELEERENNNHPLFPGCCLLRTFYQLWPCRAAASCSLTSAGRAPGNQAGWAARCCWVLGKCPLGQELGGSTCRGAGGASRHFHRRCWVPADTFFDSGVNM